MNPVTEGDAAPSGTAGTGTPLVGKPVFGAGLESVIPEKYRALGADGQFDVTASVSKLAGGYGALAERMRVTGAPPATVAEYVLTFDGQPGIPEDFDADAFRQTPEIAAMLEQMHARGFTSEQVSWVMAEAVRFMGDRPAVLREECEAQLREVWRSPAEYTENTRAAIRAATAFAQDAGIDPRALATSPIANDPMFVRLMARIGREMQEAPPIPSGSGHSAAPSIDDQIASIRDELMQLPQHHPSRDALRDRMLALYEQKVGSRPGNVFLTVNSKTVR